MPAQKSPSANHLTLTWIVILLKTEENTERWQMRSNTTVLPRPQKGVCVCKPT